MAATSLHVAGFMGLSYFFRFRRLTKILTVGIASGYMAFFAVSNNILYKTLVDRPVLTAARNMGLGAHAQPVGTRMKRSISYK